MPCFVSGNRGIEFPETLVGCHRALRDRGTQLLAGAISDRFAEMLEVAGERNKED